MSSGRIRTVFFDFGGTLVEQIADPVDVWFEILLARGLQVSREDLGAAYQEANEWFQDVVFAYHGRTRELWPEYDRRVLARLGIEDPTGQHTMAVQEQFNLVRWNRPYPETDAVLDALRTDGRALHVISNATDEIHDRIRELGLSAYFDSVTCSQEAGANKPDPAPFRLALRRAGCAPAEAMHVGNTYAEDVIGARGVGIAPVLVDREGSQSRADCPRIANLTGILKLVR